MSVAGYAPSLSACASCGLEGPHRAFSPAAGGSLCTVCRVPGSANPAGGVSAVMTKGSGCGKARIVPRPGGVLRKHGGAAC